MDLTVRHPLIDPILREIHETPLPIGNEAILRHFREIRNTYEGAVLWTVHHRLGLLSASQVKEVSAFYQWKGSEALFRYYDSKLTLCIHIFNHCPPSLYQSPFLFWGAILKSGMRHEFTKAMDAPSSKRSILSSWRSQLNGLRQVQKVNPIPSDIPELEAERMMWDLAIMIATYKPTDTDEIRVQRRQFVEEAFNPCLDAMGKWNKLVKNKDFFIRFLNGGQVCVSLKSKRTRPIYPVKSKTFKSGRGRKSK